MADQTNNNDQDLQKIIRDVIAYLQLSTMEAREKAMWMLLLPSMEKDKILKLKASLEKEVNSITDLYLTALSPKTNG